MPRIKIVDTSGDMREVDATEGLSVMEVIRDNGFDDLLALCGGCCSCATCHVYADASVLEKLPAISEEEDALLDSSDHRKSNSRLSCQLRVTPALEGGLFTIAPED